MTPYKPPARDVARALAELPIVVVGQAVLFPRARLSLQVSEPRQVRAVRVALARRGVLGVVQPAAACRPPDGARPTAAIGGLGTIVDHTECGPAGGRLQLVVLGRARVRLHQLDRASSHWRAEATVLPSLDTPVAPAELTALHAAASRFRTLLGEGETPRGASSPADGDPGAVADHYAHGLLPDAGQRQEILETLDVHARVLRVAEILTLQCCLLQDDADRPSN